jgi:hypothetical protein
MAQYPPRPNDVTPDNASAIALATPATPIELADADLEEISGGIDISFSSSMFQKSSRSSRSSRRRRRREAAAQSSTVNSSAFQFMGLGFNSASEVMTVLEGLSKFFNR